MSKDDLGRVVMVVPTYNEADNLRVDRRTAARAVPGADVLVVDDGSPDGTGDVADELAAEDPQVSVVHRTQKAGLGAAYLHGFAVALERGYDVVGEMDADGSHQPEQLPRLLDALRDADLVIGSRWVPGGSVVNWPWPARRSPLGQPLRPGRARHPGARRHRRLPALPAQHARGDRPRDGRVLRLLLPGRPGVAHAQARASASSRCRSSSSSGSAGVEDDRDVATESLRRITVWGLANAAARRATYSRRWRDDGPGRRRREAMGALVGAGAAVHRRAGRRDLPADPGRTGHRGLVDRAAARRRGLPGQLAGQA